MVFDDRPSGALVPMGRSSSKDDADSVRIPAVFVSRESGLLLERCGAFPLTTFRLPEYSPSLTVYYS